jgi:Kef-type K+ transport systems, membrane components
MTGDTTAFPHLLLMIAAVLVTARLFGAAAVKLGQQAILAELIAGIVLGGSVLGILDPNEPVIHAWPSSGCWCCCSRSDWKRICGG